MGVKRRGRGARWLGFAAFLGAMVLLFSRFVPDRGPEEVALNSPAVLVEGLFLPYEPEAVLWSPDGSYLAILTVDYPKVEIAVLETAAGTAVGRVAPPPAARSGTTWSSDNRLWVRTETGWDGYGVPFGRRVARTPMPGPVPGRLELPREGAYQPESGLVVAVDDHPERRTASWPQRTASWPRGHMRLTAWKAGKLAWDIPFLPREPDNLRQVYHVSFSPDGARLGFTVAGQVGLEQAGRDELWILDTATGKLEFLHAGGSRWWEIVDYSVQSVTASWTPDGREVVFGDSTFGVEALDVTTRRRRRILPPRWGNDAQAGKDWIAFEPTQDRLGYRSSSSLVERVAVVSRDGRWWGRMRGEYDGWRALAWAWDRAGERLALVGEGADGYQVLIWRVQRL
jgi:hypothetical protein